MLQEKEKAPLFTLPDQNGHPVSLSDFAGKKVVLYFYPRDNTPGCIPPGLRLCRRLGRLRRSGGNGDRNQQRFGVLPSKVFPEIPVAFYLAFRSGTACNPGLRRLAGEKTLRQNQHGSSAHHLPH